MRAHHGIRGLSARAVRSKMRAGGEREGTRGVWRRAVRAGLGCAGNGGRAGRACWMHWRATRPGGDARDKGRGAMGSARFFGGWHRQGRRQMWIPMVRAGGTDGAYARCSLRQSVTRGVEREVTQPQQLHAKAGSRRLRRMQRDSRFSAENYLPPTRPLSVSGCRTSSRDCLSVVSHQTVQFIYVEFNFLDSLGI